MMSSAHNNKMTNYKYYITIGFIICQVFKFIPPKTIMIYSKGEDFKAQREKLVQEIRKSNRQAQFNKRRNQTLQLPFLHIQIDLNGGQQPHLKPNKFLIVDEQRQQPIENFIKTKYFPEMFPQLVTLLYSDEILEKHHAIIGIRKVLSLNDTPPISLVFQYNILPMIIQCMKQDLYPHLKLQATWIVSNIATGGPDDITALMEFDILPILIAILIENKPGIADQAIWAVGNLAGDSAALRDKLIDAGGVDAVIHFINNTEIRNNLIQAVWALSNMCRGTPLPNHSKIYKAVPILCKIVSLNILDEENLSDCLWAISYSVDGPKQRINPFIQSKAVANVIEHSKSHLLSIASPALRILGTTSTGNEAQTQCLLDNKILDVFEQLLDSNKSLVRRQVCWTLSNIAAGTRVQINELLGRQSLLQSVLRLFELDSSQIKREICYIFANMVFLGDRERVQQLLLSKQVMRYYGECIVQRSNLKLVQTCLDTLPMLFDFGERLRKSAEDGNMIIQNFLSYPGVTEGFEQLNQIQSARVYEKALKMYEKYFDADGEGNKMQCD